MQYITNVIFESYDVKSYGENNKSYAVQHNLNLQYGFWKEWDLFILLQ